jgi:hypothetical protein
MPARRLEVLTREGLARKERGGNGGQDTGEGDEEGWITAHVGILEEESYSKPPRVGTWLVRANRRLSANIMILAPECCMLGNLFGRKLMANHGGYAFTSLTLSIANTTG